MGGRFSEHYDARDDAASDGFYHYGYSQSETPEAPLSPVGQDERRMQVRAYNHWAALLGSGNFPDIAALKPETLEDFGPYGVLLDFGGKRGVDDPAIRFLGSRLAEECGTDAAFKRLSDVPGRSLLSRITDHYLQILANQAPIGFEAEFVNQRGAAVLYRGILMPWSSDGEAIDFVFGVINWKEVADAATADALLSVIDAALEVSTAPPLRQREEIMMDGMREPGEFTSDHNVQPLAVDAQDGPYNSAMPAPAFGAPPAATDEAPFELVDEAADEDSEEDSEWGAGFAGFGEDDAIYTVDYGAQGLEDGETGDEVDDVVDPLADESASLGLLSLVSRGLRAKQSVVLPGVLPTAPDHAPNVAIPEAYAPPAAAPISVAAAEEVEDDALELVDELDVLDYAPATELNSLRIGEVEIGRGDNDDDFPAVDAAGAGDDEPEGLYDCLAAARELAQTARSSEDRGRKALYQAVSRAYDFSLEAAASPEDFDDLLAENGLTVQERAPMTPIVKLVFGADYDKTRLTEYATILGYAHRTAVARGTLGNLLAEANGGLKAIVQAERRARKGGDEAASKPDGIRTALAKKLRKLDTSAFDELSEDGPEFALVMVRRLPTGELVMLGEVPDDVALVEKAARRLLG